MLGCVVLWDPTLLGRLSEMAEFSILRQARPILFDAIRSDGGPQLYAAEG